MSVSDRLIELVIYLGFVIGALKVFEFVIPILARILEPR